MYGIFLENLNHAVDGGLYAELIQNRGFEDAKPPEGYIYHDGRWVDSLDENAYDAGFARFGYFTNGLPFWSLVKDGGAQGSMNLDMDNPLTPESPRSCRLEIDKASSGRLGIANDGFWGIGVAPGEKFKLSFWARCADGFDGTLTATLEDDNGNVLQRTRQCERRHRTVETISSHAHRHKKQSNRPLRSDRRCERHRLVRHGFAVSRRTLSKIARTDCARTLRK